jgi:hypothetical protein
MVIELRDKLMMSVRLTQSERELKGSEAELQRGFTFDQEFEIFEKQSDVLSCLA